MPVAEKVAERKCQLLKTPGILIVGKHICQFILERRPAAWFQYDHRHAGAVVRTKLFQKIDPPPSGHIQEAIIVKRPSAAHVGHRHFDAESGIFKDLVAAMAISG